MAPILTILRRTAVGLGILTGLVVVGGILFFCLMVYQNLQLRDEVQAFCASFRTGDTINLADVLVDARERGYQAPTFSGSSAQMIYKRSPTAVRWTCTIDVKDGRVVSATFRGYGGFN